MGIRVIRPGDGERAGGGPIGARIIEDGSHTGHRLGLVEATLPPGPAQPPQHIHHEHEEVLSSRLARCGLPVVMTTSCIQAKTKVGSVARGWRTRLTRRGCDPTMGDDNRGHRLQWWSRHRGRPAVMVGTHHVSRALADRQLAAEVLEQGSQNALALLGAGPRTPGL
jgi:hypothetical protein